MTNRPRQQRRTRTPRAALSGVPPLDEAAAILADIEGVEALEDVRLVAEYNRRRSRQRTSYQIQRSYRYPPMPNTSPSLGIFWAVTGPDGRTHLLTHPCALADAETYGDCITSPAAHFQTWEAWRRGQPKPLLALVIVRDEYERWPRGQIVYEPTPDRFVIYADKKLLGPDQGTLSPAARTDNRPVGPPLQPHARHRPAVARPRSRGASLSNHKTSLEPHPQRIDKVRQKICHSARMPGSAPPGDLQLAPQSRLGSQRPAPTALKY